jgi:hypothetical protein
MVLAAWIRSGREGGDVPECSFGTDAQVLQDEPDADTFRGVLEAESTSSEAPNKISRKHSSSSVVGAARYTGGEAPSDVVLPRVVGRGEAVIAGVRGARRVATWGSVLLSCGEGQLSFGSRTTERERF